ncbi:cytochrome o ubiquinol oxidase subunit III [Bartonella sp. HY329]|uniref:cytochrome o ubiquinol oxidase subunit III n=1 Tax=unclassified Bartonella TaxID=2645622 RepID=UPI0021C7D4EE|nr:MULTISPECIES: cytochrome o ubiquinol oxidase subunit III [unclassified Bartonella]UXM95697.1 cytochrome o ubiquinol oxidase subunit III [Bartonella sp. HY329]UXN10022.1 cytochrome o ubiquinol oxidase subunit III [Bartonella sp. HY328]
MSATALNNTHADDHGHGHEEVDSVKTFGFFVYILQDLILFATLFANFAVFSSAYAEGIVGKSVIDLNFVAVETAFLLLSSITYGFAMIQLHRNNISGVRLWLGITFIFGIAFIAMELYEFAHLFHEGAQPWTSAYWASFFTLVGTHGLHVTAGLIWMAVMFVHLARTGLSSQNKTRLTCLSLFWHFLDIVWVGVFTVVYLLGAL